MNLLCIGINHRTAPLAVRESVWYSDDEIQRALPQLKARFFHEAVLVSTCNRTELYGTPLKENGNDEEIADALIALKGAEQRAAANHFHALHGLRVVKHIYNVASGIDSMVLGDVQILGQMKSALQYAQQAHAAGTILMRLFQTASRVGKRTKTETELSQGAISVSYAAVELACKIFDDLGTRKALLVGTGETGRLAAKHLSGKNIGTLLLANRTREHAEALASEIGGTIVDYGNFVSHLSDVDVLVTALNVSGFVVTAKELYRVMKGRGSSPLAIIDLGVPRNVDPAVNEIGNVFLYDIDSLNRIVDQNLAKRKQEIPKVQSIIDEEVHNFYHWYDSLQVTPTIQELRARFETIRDEEVSKNISRFAQEDRERVEILTKRIVNKILHTPMINLKNGSNGEASEEVLKKISAIRSLFGLGNRRGSSGNEYDQHDEH